MLPNAEQRNHKTILLFKEKKSSTSCQSSVEKKTKLPDVTQYLHYQQPMKLQET
jgi:hypothetical protein